MFKKIVNHIRSQINLKIILITFLCLVIFITAIVTVIYRGMNQLKDETLGYTEAELKELVNEYYNNYIEAVDLRVESEVNQIFDELHILSNIIQTFFSHNSEMSGVIKAMSQSEFFKDHLVQNPKYYQNIPKEPTSVLIASYMIDDYGNVKDDAIALVKDTQFMDLILPAFADYGIDKLQVYFQGGENKEIFRLAPWADLGGSVVDVYPEIFDQPIWEAFNPGLAGQWEEWIKQLKNPKDMNNLLRVTPPVQDGLTGQIVLTFSQPLANEDMTEFEGTVSYDVSIDHVIQMIEDVKIAESGFAFAIQGDENVFAINEQGLKTFGLLTDEESTTDSQIGFNPMERLLSNSIYEDVQKLEFNGSEQNEIKEIRINGEKYFMASKNLLSYQTWSAERGFYDVYWRIGFVAPYDEVFSMYNAIDVKINNELNSINLDTLIITISIAVVMLFFIYRFTTLVTSDLVNLTANVKEAKSKNYDVHFETKGKDEVSVLTGAFNDMLAEIKSSFKKMEVQNETLKAEIHERKQKDRIIDYLENFDAGTDLPNKKALLNILKDITADDQGFVSLVVIGLDEFRKVNEAYSWTFGDKLMNKIADEMRQLLPQETLLFKLSGDEFAFIIKETKFKFLVDTVENVSQLFKKPFVVDNNEIIISSSIGISSYPYDSQKPVDIFKYATNAMIHAKEVNKGKYEFYNAEVNTSARMRMEMVSEMRNGLSNEEFELLYQPIVDTRTGFVTGMEALIRWNSENLGPVMPSVFIPLAEQSRQIIPIGNWVLKRALSDTKKLHDLGFKKLNVAVNVSVIQFMEDDFIKNLRQFIEETKIQSERVTIEITENLFINDLEKILPVLKAIRETGVLISVDDFGTGFSSLSYIKNLPLSKLKIDRAFINEIHDDKSRMLMSGIIGLAHNLNLSIVAEGVETLEQLEFIREKSCEEAQGYYFSKPVTYEQLIEYLSK
ncbi:MAG: EAL domain-containing protein [Clostridia bacterium]|nr:EAL domain-containing protein [Clostridia bacterium]